MIFYCLSPGLGLRVRVKGLNDTSSLSLGLGVRVRAHLCAYEAVLIMKKTGLYSFYGVRGKGLGLGLGIWALY